jgi:hypothetical protein
LLLQLWNKHRGLAVAEALKDRGEFSWRTSCRTSKEKGVHGAPLSLLAPDSHRRDLLDR